ncbi:MAG: HAMP domain-containing protein [Candidatus Omnitrophica bacterium]|nr:HAMP domain-containing protein [Candidatus Omnitrophota bacterium]
MKEYSVRKHFLVQRSLQFKYMSLVLFTILIVSGMIVLTVYFTHWTLMTEKFGGVQMGIALDEVFKILNLFLAFEIPIALIIAAFASVLLSHKIAGPVYRLQKVAYEVSRGDLTRNVRLRRDDELKNLSAAFNSVVENMHLLVEKDRKLIFELSGLANVLYVNLKDKKIDEDEALTLIRKLNDLIGELKTLIMQYKTEKS